MALPQGSNHHILADSLARWSPPASWVSPVLWAPGNFQHIGQLGCLKIIHSSISQIVLESLWLSRHLGDLRKGPGAFLGARKSLNWWGFLKLWTGSKCFYHLVPHRTQLDAVPSLVVHQNHSGSFVGASMPTYILIYHVWTEPQDLIFKVPLTLSRIPTCR